MASSGSCRYFTNDRDTEHYPSNENEGMSLKRQTQEIVGRPYRHALFYNFSESMLLNKKYMAHFTRLAIFVTTFLGCSSIGATEIKTALEIKAKCKQSASSLIAEQREQFVYDCLASAGITSSKPLSDTSHVKLIKQFTEVSLTLREELQRTRDSGSVFAIEPQSRKWCARFLKDLGALENMSVPLVPDDVAADMILDSGPSLIIEGKRITFATVPVEWHEKEYLITVYGSCADYGPHGEYSECSAPVQWFNVYKAISPSKALNEMGAPVCSTQLYSRDAFEYWKPRTKPIEFRLEK